MRRLSLLILLSITLFSCSSSSDDDPFLRILHAGPGVGPVNVEVNGVRLAAGLSYGQVVDYQKTDSQQAIIEVFNSATSARIMSVTANLQENQKYTFFVAGSAGSPETLLIQDSSTRPGVWDVSIRTVNLAATAGLVDVYVTGPGRLLIDETPISTSVPYRANTGYHTFGIGDGQFRVRATQSFQKTAIADSGTIELDDRARYTLVMIESPAGGAPYSFVTFRDR